ncbi:hypothetical protein GYMLUDRAFT_33699 [Collybiopsis luxurians FD-317 M1]|nr:hypothetical protein GYMLUDRAFT_33699 [Collybiopsis luxurians FD-317 M1]
MARRAANLASSSTSATHLSKGGQPGRRAGYLNDPNESAFSRFLREQIFAPEKLPGNISVAVGIGMFVGGIAAVRTWGDILIPA